MNKYPSIIDTYYRAFNLYFNTYLEVLPFTLLMAMAQYFSLSQPLTSYYLVFIIYFLVTCLLFSITTCGIYQKYYQQPFNYKEIVLKGSRRVLQIIFASLILFLPIISIIGLIAFVINGPFFLIVGSIVFGFLAVNCIYFSVSPILIIAKELNAWEGLKQSWRLTRGYFWITFILFAIFILLYQLIFFGVFKLYANFTDEIMIIVGFPFLTSMMIIHCDNLENIYQKTIDHNPMPRR